jgi:hypothetical protein
MVFACYTPAYIHILMRMLLDPSTTVSWNDVSPDLQTTDVHLTKHSFAEFISRVSSCVLGDNTTSAFPGFIKGRK